MWDRIFNTYVEPPKERPPIGLTGQPDLQMNPLRLLMAGLVQIIYELIHNKDWKTRWAILTASSEYTPLISRDFAIKSPNINA